MNLIKKLKHSVRNVISGLVKPEVESSLQFLVPQLIDFRNSDIEDRQSYHDHTRDPLAFSNGYYLRLKDRLVATGIPVEETDVDINDFENWLSLFPEMEKFYAFLGNAWVEKCLEHYLAFRHLNVARGDIYIDIAAAGSPWAKILRKRNIKAYRLDLAFPAGIHGINIGADAADTNLRDGFCDVMSAHCAFECFMGDADVRFAREARRLLKANGRYAIIPLYLEEIPFITTSPYCDQSKIEFDSRIKKVWREDNFKVPFSRHYSPESFKDRIYTNIPGGMKVKVLYFNNLSEVMRRYPRQVVYCNFMLCCEQASDIPQERWDIATF